MEHCIPVTSGNYDEAAGKGPVLLEFWADWCGPCKMFAPVLEELAAERAGRLTVGKVNVDSEPALAQRFAVASVPTLVLLQDGQPVKKTVGFQRKQQLEQWLT